MDNKGLGAAGERAAAEVLELKGYNVIERNYRCSAGEIDLIAVKDGRISFVEVKTRESCCYGRPCEAVTGKKQERIKHAAVFYLTERREKDVRYDMITFDVIEIMLNHIKEAF